MEIKFRGYNITLQFLRSDRSVRVLIDTSMDEWDKIKEIPKLPNGVYKIAMELEAEEE